MSSRALIRLFVLLLLPAAVAGCSYPISKELRQEARSDLTFSMVLKDPAAYKGSIVLWGGSIIKTVPLNRGSDIFVLQTPLDYTEMPEDSIYSEGRFIGRTPHFLDPEIYRNGSKITLAGEIVGEETNPLGKLKYTYPVVAIRELHLWKKKRNYVFPYRYYDWYGGPGWDWGWYGPDYWSYEERDEDEY